MRKLRPDERGSRASDSESDEGGVMGGWRVDGNDVLIFDDFRMFFCLDVGFFGGELFFDVC